MGHLKLLLSDVSKTDLVDGRRMAYVGHENVEEWADDDDCPDDLPR